jgi:hypothetical protein
VEEHALVIDYDTDRFPFHRILAAEVFRVKRLDQLHLAWQRRTRRDELTYADNLALRRRMQQLPDDATFYPVYHAWIARVLAPRYGKRITYSAHPKMRVHLAGTGGVSEFHRDVDVTGRADQINCYLPFTDVHDTCTIWAESRYGARDSAQTVQVIDDVAERAAGPGCSWGSLTQHGRSNIAVSAFFDADGMRTRPIRGRAKSAVN